ncbi:MAG: polysaccharide deacetylase family protein [Mucilaginibacter sp.]|uniref:polysaccharide deacetylase family protein n=1 Tax=Mucilaginibacter sp. TaxID=1882438 RepID=UPI0031A49C3A
MIIKTGKKLYQKAKYLYTDTCHMLGLNNSFYNKARGNRILIYHGICKQDHTRFNPIFLKLKTFEAHLKFYKKHFNVISLDDYYQQRFSNNKFNICITFDDGFANNYHYVLPLLEKYQLPATFFITAINEAGYDVLWNDFLGIISKYGPATLLYKNELYKKGLYDKYIHIKNGISLIEKLRSVGFEEKAEMMELLYPLVPFKNNKNNDDYWMQMTGQQIKALSASPYASIGAHGYYHNDLARININHACIEMVQTKKYLERITGNEVNSFAFPYGSYNHEVVQKAKEAGYEQLLAMDFHFEEDHTDPTLRERFTVNPFISTINQQYATINKRYE